MAFFGTVKDAEGGYKMGDYVSALQKALRRSEPQLAVFAAVKLAEGNGNDRRFPGSVWNRLKVCALEDFGPAELLALHFVKEQERAYNRTLEGYRREHSKEGKLTPVEAFSACPKAKAIMVETVLTLCFLPCRSRILAYWNMNALSQVNTDVPFEEARKRFCEGFQTTVKMTSVSLGASEEVPELVKLAIYYKVCNQCEAYWKDVGELLEGTELEGLKTLYKDCSATKRERESSMGILAMVAALYFPRALTGTGPKTPFSVGLALSTFGPPPGQLGGKGCLRMKDLKALNLKAYDQWMKSGASGSSGVEVELFHAIYKAQLGVRNKRKLPTFVFDKHTEEGKAKGRGYRHFFEVSAELCQMAPWCEEHERTQKERAKQCYLVLERGEKSAHVLQRKREQVFKKRPGDVRGNEGKKRKKKPDDVRGNEGKLVKRMKVGKMQKRVAFLPSHGVLFTRVEEDGVGKRRGNSSCSKSDWDNGTEHGSKSKLGTKTGKKSDWDNGPRHGSKLGNGTGKKSDLDNGPRHGSKLGNGTGKKSDLDNGPSPGPNTVSPKGERDPHAKKIKDKRARPVKRVDQLFKNPLLSQTPTAKHKPPSFFAFRKDTRSGGSVFVKGPFLEKQDSQVRACLFLQEAKKVLDPSEKYLGRTGAREIKAVPLCGFLPERIGATETAYLTPLSYLMFKDLAGYNPKDRVEKTSKSFGSIQVYDKEKGRARPIDETFFQSKSGHAKVALLLNLAFRWAFGVNDTCWGNILYKPKRMSGAPVYSVDEHQVHTNELKGLFKKPPSKKERPILSRIIKAHHSTVKVVLEDWLGRIFSIIRPGVKVPSTFRLEIVQERLQELSSLEKFMERTQVNQ